MSRTAYIDQQIERSQAKWDMNFCKVPVDDVLRYYTMLGPHHPICCMGVRQGLEVTRFADVFGDPVMGMEINPDCVHPAVRIGSFDEPPTEWQGKFGLLFSNSLDHAEDARKTIQTWALLLKPEGFMIVALNGHEAPVGADCAGFTVDDLVAWLKPTCTLIWRDTGHYPEAWFQHV